MQWTPGGTSEDVEDRRGESGGGGGGAFNIGGLGGMHLGIGGTILLLILSFVFKTNLFTGGAPSGPSGPDPGTRPIQTSTSPSNSPDQQREVQFVTAVLKDVQDTWEKLLPQSGATYHHAKLVLFRDATRSGCGRAQAESGPFYCPEDEKVYIDLGFYEELKDRFGAPGEFAQAYVLAHEIGHHVQKILGIEGKVNRMEQSNPDAANHLSVDLELQADCFAGVWAHEVQQRPPIDRGDVRIRVDQADVRDGLRAAAAVGDDRLQKMSTGHVNPETFTHGSSAQRTNWFNKGLESGQISACNTFKSN